MIVSIFTPVCEYYSRAARCTLRDLAAASSSINDSAEKSNSHMTHSCQVELAGEMVVFSGLPSLPRFYAVCFSL